VPTLSALAARARRAAALADEAGGLRGRLAAAEAAAEAGAAELAGARAQLAAMQAERARWEAMLDAANAGLEEDAARAAAAAEAAAAREADLAARLAAAEADSGRAAAAEARVAAAEAAADERGVEAGALRARLAGLEVELADARARAGPGSGPEGGAAEGAGLVERLAAAEAELAELREDHNALLACLGQETAKARAAAARRVLGCRALGCTTPRGLWRAAEAGNAAQAPLAARRVRCASSPLVWPQGGAERRCGGRRARRGLALCLAAPARGADLTCCVSRAWGLSAHACRAIARARQAGPPRMAAASSACEPSGSGGPCPQLPQAGGATPAGEPSMHRRAPRAERASRAAGARAAGAAGGARHRL